MGNNDALSRMGGYMNPVDMREIYAHGSDACAISPKRMPSYRITRHAVMTG